jgi:sigma-54 dependent transcriptional regulator, acetoin dehydrogenase operon transcriptional activator AcoR
MVICATHRNLRELVAQGQFREDLYYRLNGLVVKLPALRERTDLRTIIDRILAAEAHEGAPFALDEEVAALFARYRWPGNFRQLDNALRAAKVMADADHVIRREHLSDDLLDELIAPLKATPTSPAIASPAPVALDLPAAPAGLAQTPAPTAGSTSLDAAERALIQRALDTYDGNVSAVARVLGVSRNTIYRKMEKMKTEG